MSLNQTKTARNLSSGQTIEPQLILEIDGIVGDDGDNLLFSTSDVILQLLKFDAIPPYEFDVEPVPYKFDGGVVSRNSRDYISWKQTTKNIKSQLLIEKGGAGSVQNFKVELINKAGELTPLFTSGNFIDDIFGQRCELYLNYRNGIHPTDSALIFQGIIKGVEQSHGAIVVDIAHPDQLKRQQLFESISTRLDGGIDDTTNLITVDNASEFTVPTPEQQSLGFKSYIKIEDEYMQILSRSGNTFTVLRNQLESTAQAAEDNADVVSHYRLTEQPIEMMLRLMLSDPEKSNYLEGLEAFAFKRTDQGDISNAIYFDSIDVFQKFQIVAGDTITSTGAVNPENNFTRTVTGTVKTLEGSYILVDGPELVLETDTDAQISLLSQFNLYPIGLGMKPKDIDMQAVLDIKDEVDLGLPQISIDIDEEIDLKEWMEKELALPNALYFIPKARVSIKATRPPLVSERLVELGPNNIINIESLKVKRTFGKYFYNTVTYAYEYNPVKDKYEEYNARINVDSLGRVGLGRRGLKIQANGFRAGGDVQNTINTISRRLLDRYKFGARYISGLQVAWKDGNTVEIGDIVNVNGVKIPNLETGENILNDLLFEVTNKSTGFKDGKITLDLLETSFGADDKFATTSPSSKVVSGLSSNSVLVEKSFTTSDAEKEQDKWLDYLPCKVQLHNADYTVSQILTLTGFSQQNDNEAEFLESITIDPTNTVMDFAPYDQATSKQKLLHTFISPVTDITSGTSSTEFECDTSNLFIGGTIIIRRADFTESPEVEIINISGTTVTTEDLGFTPDNTDKVESGFPSDSKPFYRFV